VERLESVNRVGVGVVGEHYVLVLVSASDLRRLLRTHRRQGRRQTSTEPSLFELLFGIQFDALTNEPEACRRDPCHQCETTLNDDERSWIAAKIILCIYRHLNTYYIIGYLIED